MRRFVFFSALDAGAAQRTRFFRAKWVAERAVESSPLETAVFAPSIVYDRDDPWITLLRRFSFLPVLPVSGEGRAAFQPIWSEDVAALRRRGARRRRSCAPRYELAGPETMTYDEMSDLVSRLAGRPRPLIHVPLPAIKGSLEALRLVFGEAVFATWEEAELMEVAMLAASAAPPTRRPSGSSREGCVMSSRPRRRCLARHRHPPPWPLPRPPPPPPVAISLVPPKPDVLLGVSDRGSTEGFNSFAELTGKHPALMETFLGWGNSVQQGLRTLARNADPPGRRDLHPERADVGRDDHPGADRPRRRRRLPAAAEPASSPPTACPPTSGRWASRTAASTPGRGSNATAR